MRASRAVAVLVLAGVVASVATIGVQAAPSARVLDRTFSCEAGFVGGLHMVDLAVGFSTTEGSSRLGPSASVTRNMYEAALVYLTSDGATVHRQRCSPAKRTLRLPTNGMRGGGVHALGSEARCETPRRFLLRVSAEFTAAPNAETVRQFGFPQLIVRGDVIRSAVAVGTLTGQPIAYMSIARSGTARLFTMRTCKED